MLVGSCFEVRKCEYGEQGIAPYKVSMRSPIWMRFTSKSSKMGPLSNKAAYMVIGIDLDGNKDVLGMCIGENESPKFWLSIPARDSQTHLHHQYD